MCTIALRKWKMIPYAAGVIVPLALTLLVRNAKKDEKQGGSVESQVIPLGTTGSKIQLALTGRKTSPLSQISSRSRARTTATCFFLGTKRLIAREVETSEDGKLFEKLHLGDYEWKTFWQTLEAVSIFAVTREEWFIVLHGYFRRNVTVVTIYSSLGEEALCHSLNEICSLCSWQPTNKK